MQIYVIDTNNIQSLLSTALHFYYYLTKKRTASQDSPHFFSYEVYSLRMKMSIQVLHQMKSMEHHILLPYLLHIQILLK